MQTMTTNKNFWNVKTDGKKSRIDLFGYVGGSKEWNDGFNEKDFLDEFRSIPEDNEIDISINSFGGSVFTALSIYELLKSHEGAITFRVDGVAMSAATIITSVPNAKVIMPKGAIMMIHKVSSIAAGNAEDFRKAAETMDKLEDNILNIYAEKTGKTVDEIRPMVNEETYFDAAEAVEFGLADEMDESTDVKNIKTGNVVNVNGLEVDVKFFAHAPEGLINKAEANNAPAIQNQANKEDKTMTLEELKAEHPDLVEAIRNEALNEGITNERTRIQEIYSLGVTGHDELVAEAISKGKTKGDLAIAVLEAENAKKAAILKNRNDDAAELDGIPAVSNEGLEPKPAKKSREEKLADAKADFEAVKNLK